MTPPDLTAFRRFAAVGRREVERRMIELIFEDHDHEQAGLWLAAVDDWRDPRWRTRQSGHSILGEGLLTTSSYE